jgi:AraC-like DNA-binding protein
MANIPIRHINPTLNEPILGQSFRIRDVSTLLGGKDMVQGLHRHDFFFVLALANGMGNHEIDFVKYRIKNNCIFIMRPGQVHALTVKAGSTGFLMEFSKSFYHLHSRGESEVLRKATNTTLCHAKKGAFEKLQLILSYIIREYKEQMEGYEAVIKANLDIFFIELLRQRQKDKDFNRKGGVYEQERLEQFLDILELNITRHKQVSHYADQLNISAYQLNAITRTCVGKTASQIINDYLVLEAKRYLLVTSDQVNQIAYHLGYEDPSYFIRFFKKHTGHSPDVFRSKF